MLSARYKRLLERMQGAGLDAFVLLSRTNIRYLSGFTGSTSILLVHETGCTLFTDFRYMLQAKEQLPWQFEVVETQRGNDLELLAQRLARLGCKTVGFEDRTISYQQYRQVAALGFSFTPASGLVDELRLIKDHFELCALRLAQQAADAAFGQLLSLLQPGMTELDVAAELDYLLKKNGAEAAAFDIIVASGKNGALCHAVPTRRCLAPGDMVVLDFGARVQGYCSDMTRTVAIGRPDKKLQDIYAVVLDAQLCALDALRPGISARQLHELAAEVIQRAGYGDCFGHGLGHGFGLDIHEPPTANARSGDVFQPGMTITIEPGIYIEGLGGVRIEDCCIVTQQGHENLTSAPKQLLIIE